MNLLTISSKIEIYLPKHLIAELTPTQIRILEILSDTKRHKRDELKKALPFRYGGRRTFNISTHVTDMRIVLARAGQDIVCELHKNSLFYRWIKNLEKIRTE